MGMIATNITLQWRRSSTSFTPLELFLLLTLDQKIVKFRYFLDHLAQSKYSKLFLQFFNQDGENMKT